MFRRGSIAVVLVIGLTLTGSGVAQAAEPPIPASMAALGDSITTGYNTGPSSFQDYPAGSWSTGTVLHSHANLLGPATVAFNYAVSGTKMADLKTQAEKAAVQGASYVTILMGGNDLCTKTVADMTPADSFETSFRAALAALPSTTKIFVASIPRVRNLWDTLHTIGTARFVWSLFGICQSLLANPNSTAKADRDRRAAVDLRNQELNARLAAACVAPRCQFDGFAVYNTTFAATDVSARDYFHPSPSGQKLLACTTWKASYWPSRPC
jgi:lysophospholipase L1-like esterase